MRGKHLHIHSEWAKSAGETTWHAARQHPLCSLPGEMGCYLDDAENPRSGTCHPCGGLYMEPCPPPHSPCHPGFVAQPNADDPTLQSCVEKGKPTCGLVEGLPCCMAPDKACIDPYVCQLDGFIPSKVLTCQLSLRNCSGLDQECCLDTNPKVGGYTPPLLCEGSDWPHSKAGKCQVCPGCASNEACAQAYDRCVHPTLALHKDMRCNVMGTFEACSTVRCKLNKGDLQSSVQAAKWMHVSSMGDPPAASNIRSVIVLLAINFSTGVCVEYLEMITEEDPLLIPAAIQEEIQMWQATGRAGHFGLIWDGDLSNWSGSAPRDIFALQVKAGAELMAAAKRLYRTSDFGFNDYQSVCKVAVMEPPYDASKYPYAIDEAMRPEIEAYARAPQGTLDTPLSVTAAPARSG